MTKEGKKFWNFMSKAYENGENDVFIALGSIMAADAEKNGNPDASKVFDILKKYSEKDTRSALALIKGAILDHKDAVDQKMFDQAKAGADYIMQRLLCSAIAE